MQYQVVTLYSFLIFVYRLKYHPIPWHPLYNYYTHLRNSTNHGRNLRTDDGLVLMESNSIEFNRICKSVFILWFYIFHSVGCTFNWCYSFGYILHLYDILNHMVIGIVWWVGSLFQPFCFVRMQLTVLGCKVIRIPCL